MSRPVLFLDDVAHGTISVFNSASCIIRADTPAAIPTALDALESAQKKGFYTAGFLSYEAGYALEPKLAPRIPEGRNTPLLWFGVFKTPEILKIPENGSFPDGWITGRSHAGPLRYNWTAGEYRKRFDKVQALIAAGDIYEANLTFGADFSFFGDPLHLYRTLRKNSACDFCAFLDTGEQQILSLSPELFFEIHDGAITCRPMKGTIARSDDPTTDQKAAATLQTSAKDRAENLMIVDLLRNDVSRISIPGSVRVPRIFEIESYPTVHQMTSTVTANVRPQCGPRDILRALFPCGSITGAPKIRAMEILQEIEGRPRDLYCGAIGIFKPNGDACFNVAIRTLTITGNHGRLGIGGAVVYDSCADAEYAEAKLKARYMDLCYQPLRLIETLRFDPASGFIRLDRHLERMRATAGHFGIPFDEAAAKATLESLTRGATGTLRVHLELSEDGCLSGNVAPLPPNPPVWTYAIAAERVSSTDRFARYKTGKRGLYSRLWQRAHEAQNCDEVIFLNEKGEIAEGSRSTIFVSRGDKLLTPPLSSGALAGVLRDQLLTEGKAIEAVLRVEDLTDQVMFGNSLRGLIPAMPENDPH